MPVRPRFRLGLDEIRLVRRRDVLAARSLEHARELAERIASEVPDLDVDGLTSALARGDVVLVRTAEAARVLDQPRVQPLQPRDEPVPARPFEPALASHVVDLLVTTDDGVPIAEATFEISDGHAFTQQATTDAQGRLHVTTPSGWAHQVRLLEPPLRLPAPLPEPVDAEGIVLARDRATPLSLSVDKRHALVCPRPHAKIVSLDGWWEAQAVLVFQNARQTTDGPLTVRSLLRAALTSARGGEVHVIGHADTKGNGGDNDALAQARARSVWLYLAGERAAWADHAFAHADVATLQAALSWAARQRGIACDPGPVDDDWGPATAEGLGGLRRHAGLSPDAPLGVDDWSAIYDLYDADLAEILITDREGLAAARARLTLAASSAKGERWPVDAPHVDGYPSAANRRVDVALCPPDHVPKRESDEIYDGTFVLEHLQAFPEVEIEIAIVDPAHAPSPGAIAKLAVGSLGERILVADDDGLLHFTALRGDRIAVLGAAPAGGLGWMASGGTFDLQEES